MRDLTKIEGHNLLMESFYRAKVDPNIRSDFKFTINGKEKVRVAAVCNKDEGWEHVLYGHDEIERLPEWPEMVELKEMFWENNDIVIQVHPRRQDYVNDVPNVLHLWKKTGYTPDLTLIYRITGELLSERDRTPRSFERIAHGCRFVAIFGETRWPTWEEVCAEKQKYFGPDCPAIQYNITPRFDLNGRFLLTLWDATHIPLPPKYLV